MYKKELFVNRVLKNIAINDDYKFLFCIEDADIEEDRNDLSRLTINIKGGKVSNTSKYSENISQIYAFVLNIQDGSGLNVNGVVTNIKETILNDGNNDYRLFDFTLELR